MMRWFIAVMAVGATFASCRCQPRITQVVAGALTVSPASLSFASTYQGFSSPSSVTLTNTGGGTLAFDLSTLAPFSVPTQHLELGSYQSYSLEVTFAPLAAGQYAGVLRIGTLEVPLTGEGLEVPSCNSTAFCLTSSFDPSSAACIDQPKPDGTACETGCVQGTCSGGVCVGQLDACDDHDACTVDACGPGGCLHSPLQCPTSSCKVGCDPQRGCGVTDAPDGTPCAPDNCVSPQVNVCISGACVLRARRPDAQCKNRWQLVEIEAHAQHAMAYDPTIDRVITFGGVNSLRTLNEVWLWDGNEWAMRTPPANSPLVGTPDVALVYDAARQRTMVVSSAFGTAVVNGPAWSGLDRLFQWPGDRRGFALAYDVARQKVVLYGGEGHADTWEFDGQDWLQRVPLTSPPALSGHAMGYDGVRNQVVLFGGSDTLSVTNETWVWNGTLSTWAKLRPAHSPPARGRAAMVFDSDRNRLVLFGGFDELGQPLDDTWEWNGDDWSPQQPPTAPPPRWAHALAYDSKRHEVLLFGGSVGVGADAVILGDTWAYAGGTWRLRAGQIHRPQTTAAAVSWNPVRASLVALINVQSSSQTWSWNWTERWSRQQTSLNPAIYSDEPSLIEFDGANTILLRATNPFSPTWLWNGEWTEANQTGPKAGALAYDSSRNRVVAVSVESKFFEPPEDWEWDRSTWKVLRPATRPSAPISACTFHAASARVVCLSKGTWEWDGAVWELRHPAHEPTLTGRVGLAYDPTRQRTVLFQPGFEGTWEWDGDDWLQRHPTVSPELGGQSAVQLVYCEELGKVLLFDGADLWVFLP